MTEKFDFDASRSRRALAESSRQQPPIPVESRATEEPQLVDYLKVIYRRRWLVGTVFSVIALAAAVYTLTATPIFEGRVELLIESDNPNVVSFKEVIDEQQSKADYYQTQYKLLESRTLAKKTIDDLKLWDSKELGGDRDPEQRPGLRQRLLAVFGRAPKPSTPEANETKAQAAVIDAFLQRLAVSPIRNSRLVDVSFRSADPKLADAAANTLAKTYIQQNLQFKFMSSKEATDWLSEQLTAQRKKVEASEAALQRYREQNDAVSLEQRQDITVQKLADLNAAVTKAKTERIEKEAVYRQLQGLQSNGAALETFPAILSNDFIQRQKVELTTLQRQLAESSEKLGDKHPDIIRAKSSIESAQAKLQTEIDKVVASVRNQYLAVQAQENSLIAALEQQKAAALGMDRKGIEYGVLARDAESNRQIYNSLLQRAKETGVSGELKTSNIRVVDSAGVPSSPVSPKRMVAVLVAIFGGLFCGVGLAFFFEHLDNTLQTPEQIRQHLGLASLGLVPALKDLKNADPLISETAPMAFSEAIQTVRTNVLFSSTDDSMRTLVVTSTGPGEGKTTVTSNLAVAFAQAAQRVLLIDADMRRPRVHDIFGGPQEPGLSNLLVGTAKVSDCIRKSRVNNLSIMPAGKIPPNPAQLLGSARFRECLKSLAESYDWVILDSPPVMAVTDATILANVADGVIFVVGSDMTSRHSAKAALDQLDHARARFIGAILNKADIDGHPYYYASYYRKEYARYYIKTGTDA